MKYISCATAYVITLLFVVALNGCIDKKSRSAAQQHRPVIEIGRIDTLPVDLDADSVSFCNTVDRALPALTALAAIQLDTFSSPADVLDDYLHSDFYCVFSKDVVDSFPEIAQLSGSLNEAFIHLSGVDKSIRLPMHVYLFVTPYNQSVVTVDSVMLIASNHYMGADYPGYEGFDEYRRLMKIPERIPYDVAEAVLVSNYPFEGGEHPTALSRMLYEGAIVYAVKNSLPDSSLAMILGYSPEQLKWCEDNESRIWQKMIVDGLLFSTSPLEISKLISPSPSTSNIHPDSPGRVGRYIGYRIVEAYLNNTRGSIVKDLLKNASYVNKDILSVAKYSPR